MDRSRSLAAVLCVVFLGLLPASGAKAEALSEHNGEWETRKRGSIALGGGLYDTYDENVQATYGADGLKQGTLTLGFRVVDVFKLDLGAFVIGERGNPLGKLTDEASAEESSMRLFGFHLGPVLRLDLRPEQALVPYGGVGLTWGIFRETETDTSEPVVGDKGGWYYTAGLELLLDRLEPARASDLDISRGINDTYIYAEYRHQVLTEVGETSGLDFSGDAVSMGLKFDF